MSFDERFVVHRVVITSGNLLTSHAATASGREPHLGECKSDCRSKREIRLLIKMRNRIADHNKKRGLGFHASHAVTASGREPILVSAAALCRRNSTRLGSNSNALKKRRVYDVNLRIKGSFTLKITNKRLVFHDDCALRGHRMNAAALCRRNSTRLGSSSSALRIKGPFTMIIR